jgi:autotransporter-associated beta strand protein
MAAQPIFPEPMMSSALRFLVVAAVGMLATTQARAQLTWNNGAGNMAWNTTSANFTGSVWNNSNPVSALFQSAGLGTVSVSNINLHSIFFNADGYVLNSGTLNFVSSVSVPGFNPGDIHVGTGYTATINSQIISGIALIKQSSGTLILGNGGNTFTGNVAVFSGTLVAAGMGSGTNSALGALNGTKTITVGTSNSSATLAFAVNNVFGGLNLTAANLPTIFVSPGSTVSSTRYNAIGNIALYGSTLTQASTDTGGYEGYQFLGTVAAFGATGATSFITSTTGRANHLRGTTAGGTTFQVEQSLIVTSPLTNPSSDYLSTGASGRVFKTGIGVLRFHGNNTYTGATTISDGTLLVGDGGSSGTLGTGTAFINAPGALAYQRSDSPTLSNAYSGNGTIIFYGTSVIDQSSYALSANSSAFTGSISLDNILAGSKARLVLSNGNQIGAAASVTVNNGSGLFFSGGSYNTTWNLTGAGWTETAGQLGAMRVGNGSTVGGTVNLMGDTRIAAWSGESTGVVSASITDGGAAFQLEKFGPGTITLSGTNTYNRGTSIAQGTLRMGANNVMPAADVVGILSGATFDLNNTSQTIGQLTGAGSVTLGSGTLTLSNNSATSSSTAISGTGQLVKAGTGTLTLSNATNTYTGGTVVQAGTLVLAAPQTGATGAIQVDAGATLQFSLPDVYGNHVSTAAPNIVVANATLTNGGAFFNTLQNVSLANSAMNNTGGFGTNFMSWSVRGVITSTGSSTITLTGAAGGLNLGQDGDTEFNVASGTLLVTGPILNNRNAANTADLSGRVVKTGSGILTLNGANTFTGGATLASGSLVVASAGALGSTGTISFTGGTLQYSAGNTVDYSGRFSTAASQVYDVHTDGQSVAWAANLTSSGGVLNKRGPGTLTLSGTNTYSGNTNIYEGTLALGSAAALGTSGQILLLGGTLQYSAANQVDYSPRLWPSTMIRVDTNGQNVIWSVNVGTITKLGNGTLTISGSYAPTGITTIAAGTLRMNRADTRSYTTDFIGSGTLEHAGTGTTIFSGNVSVPAVTISAGVVQIGSGGATGSLSGNVANSGSLRFQRNNTYTYGGIVSGIGTLQQLGTGVLTLAAANTYTGATSIAAGTIQLGIANAIPAGGALDIAAGGTLDLNGRNQVIGVLSGAGAILLNGGTLTVSSGTSSASIAGSGNLVKPGAGTLALTGPGTLNGDISVTGGTLAVESTLGSGSIFLSNLASLQFTGSTTTSRSIYLGGGSLRATAGNTLTLSNALIGGGSVSGTMATQAGSANRFLSGTQNVASAITFQGSDSVSNFVLNGTVTTPATRTTSFAAVTLGASGTMAVGGTVNASEFLSYGTIQLNAGGTLNNTGSDMTLGGGSRTFIASVGNTTSTKIDLGGNTLTVAGGFLVNNGGNFASGGGVRNGTVVVDYGGRAKGSGYYSSVFTQNGGVFSPGNSPGNSEQGASFVNEGGKLNIDIDAAGPNGTNGVGTAGASPGWGRVQVYEQLRITATSASKFTISLTSQLLGGASTPGPVSNFDSSKTHKWEVIQMQPGANLFNTTTGGTPLDVNTYAWDPNIVNVDTSAFQNNLDGGTFSTSFDLNGIGTRSVYVNFVPNPVPEPGAILAFSALGVAYLRWNRRRGPKDVREGSQIG